MSKSPMVASTEDKENKQLTSENATVAGSADDVLSSIIADTSLISRETPGPATTVSNHYLRVLRTLSACSRVVMRATHEFSLLDDICRIMVEVGGYTHSWVGYALDNAEKTVQPVAHTGFRAGFLDSHSVSWHPDSPLSKGVFGQAIHTGKPAVIRRVHETERFSPWHEFARRYNFHSVLGLPIVVNDKVIGVIGFYSDNVEGFDQQEIDLLSEVASDIGYGITVIRLRREKEAAQAALKTSNQMLELKVADRTRELFEQKERAQVTLQAITDAVITTSTTGLIDYLNPVAERLTGWNKDEACNRPLEEVFRIIDDSTRERAPNPVTMVFDSGDIVGLATQCILVRRDGREFAIQNSAAPIRDAEGHIIGAVLVFHDVSEARRIAAQLSHQARHDALTGLINRREFDARLKNALAGLAGTNRQHALMYLDLDQFKVVNDTCGHIAGDELLRLLCGILQAQLRTNDTLARLGGDEFGVLLENCDAEPALKIADALRQAISEFHFVWQDKTFTVGVSIGLVCFGDNALSESELLSAADTACYVAKDSGRNRVHVYRPDDKELASRHGEMQWVGRIRSALASNRLRLYFQRIEPIDGDKSLHVELLLRLEDENGHIVPPMAFIPAAERYNLMTVLDRWVIRQALSHFDQLCPNKEERLDMCAINLSGTSLSDDTMLDFIREQLMRYPGTAERICFEITETAAISNLTKVAALIRELKTLGCRFALDDFGSGMSSFAYLKHLPVDFLKIDGSFVKDMAHDEVDAAMVEAINSIGHVMGIQTIAEFVENETILERLRALGVDYAQGYGIARPQPCACPYGLKFTN
ncbi:MAG: EAL domain-containing protein [Burkholderiales bacterium]|nr:EAL domain-containing protein [Burkholderiales bacterium]